MRPIALLLFALVWSWDGMAAPISLSRSEAIAAAARAAIDRGVDLSGYGSPTDEIEHNDNGMSWAFLYKCKSPDAEPGCHLLIVVNRESGAARISASASEPPQAPVPREVQELVFTEEVPSKTSAMVYCLEVDRADASPEVLEKVIKAHPGTTVVRGSDCESVMDVDKGSYHKATGRPALFVSVGGFKLQDASHASVGLTTYRHGLWSGGSTIFLERDKHSWVISSRRSDWVSERMPNYSFKRTAAKVFGTIMRCAAAAA